MRLEAAGGGSDESLLEGRKERSAFHLGVVLPDAPSQSQEEQCALDQYSAAAVSYAV